MAALPLQIKSNTVCKAAHSCSFFAVNCCADDREFTFTSALQTHFSVKPLGDYPQNSQFVKLLGLGGKRILDYAQDPSHPRLTEQEADYVHFGGAH